MTYPSILIVNQNWLGDALFSTPAIRAIRKNFPKSRIACMAPARCREVLEHNPYLDEVIVYNEKTSWLLFPALIQLAFKLRQEKFDKVFLFHRSKSKALLMAMAGIPERIGFSAPNRNRFLTRAFLPPAKPVHKIDYFLHLIQSAGLELDGRTMDFSFKEGELEVLTDSLEKLGLIKGEPYVVVHPGGNWDLKRWPVGSFGAWIKIFIQRMNWKVIICGTPGEKELVDKLVAEVSNEKVLSLCGKTSVSQLAALLKNARFLLSNDSGPIHLAASQGTPIVGIFGPTDAILTGPVSKGRLNILQKNVGCQVPCYFRECDYRLCMEAITPEEVLETCVQLIQ